MFRQACKSDNSCNQPDLGSLRCSEVPIFVMDLAFDVLHRQIRAFNKLCKAFTLKALTRLDLRKHIVDRCQATAQRAFKVKVFFHFAFVNEQLAVCG